MSELYTNSAALRGVATVHNEVSATVRAWATPNAELLGAVPVTHGTIAFPFTEALVEYEAARCAAGQAYATVQDVTAAKLQTAATKYDVQEVSSTVSLGTMIV